MSMCEHVHRNLEVNDVGQHLDRRLRLRNRLVILDGLGRSSTSLELLPRSWISGTLDSS